MPSSVSLVHRYYDPATGQFLSVDPLVDQTGTPYSYAGNDPVNGADPSGLITCGGWLGWVPGCGVVTDVQNGISSATKGAVTAIAGAEIAANRGIHGVGNNLASDFNRFAAACGAFSYGGTSKVPPDLENVTTKIEGQMRARGWTPEQIQEAFANGQQVPAVKKATGGPATRYINPTTGQSVVIDDATGQIIHVGGPGFRYGPGSGDVP